MLNSNTFQFIKLFHLFIFICFSVSLQATVLNQEQMKLPKEEPKKPAPKIWSFETSFGASVYTGDEEFSLVSFEGKAAGKYPGHTLAVTSGAEYRQSDDSKQRKVSLSIGDIIDLNRISSLSNQWGAFGDIKYYKDESAGIEQKNDTLLGIGYNFLGEYRSSEKSLKLSTAFGYRDQTNTDSSKTHYSFNSTRLQWKKRVSEALKFKLEIWHTASLEEFTEDYEDKLLASLENLISKSTSLILKQESCYDNTPVAGKQKLNSISKVELKYKF